MTDRGRARTTGPRPLAEAIGRFRQQSAPQTLLASVQTCWAEAVGTSIAEQATPVAERDGVVTARCRSAVWAAELTMLAGELAQQVNQAVPDGRRVRALRFTVGAI